MNTIKYRLSGFGTNEEYLAECAKTPDNPGFKYDDGFHECLKCGQLYPEPKTLGEFSLRCHCGNNAEFLVEKG